jgi:small subunit ribosomal protein S1
MEENKAVEKIENNIEVEDFGAMLAESEQRSQKLKKGNKVSATILSIGQETSFVDIGSKIDGYLDTDELKDENGEFKYREGDTLELYIVSVEEDEIKLSRAISGNAGNLALMEAYENKVPVMGKVTGVVKGGYSVNVMGKKVFCPGSQMELKYVENQEEYVGKTLKFLITKFESNGRNVVISRIPLLREEEEKVLEEIREKMAEDNHFKGKVVRIMPFGAFVEIRPGIEGMVHISHLSWSRVKDPSEVCKIGDEVEFKILDIQKTDKNRNKISLSMKLVKPEPWSDIEKKLTVGSMVEGKVTKLMPFGVFVEVAEGIEGLVHTSELSYIHKNPKSEDIVKEGEKVEVKILEIDRENRKISLSLRQAGRDPWAEVEEKYPIGTKVTGTLEKKEKFGYFVSIEPGITALVPKSKIDLAVNVKELESASIGDELTFTISDIDVSERKMTLSPEIEGQDDWKQFAESRAEKSDQLGTVGLALMEKMKNGELSSDNK